ncbi:hypothetical protein HYX10_02525 [Candidatus Woesearchaeota archaeon]|nr:hypothetical protein [Candidatus Woesearchaeota archaeon]
MQRPRIFSKRVFRRAQQLPRIMPEPFLALEEYDRTRRLRRWGNKVRVNFTLDPAIFKAFRKYCDREGCKMSTLVERLMRKAIK